jgi:hypothetical protein
MGGDLKRIHPQTDNNLVGAGLVPALHSRLLSGIRATTRDYPYITREPNEQTRRPC